MSKLLWSLEHTGRIALLREGRNITGVAEILRPESRQGRRVGDSPRYLKAHDAVQPTPKTVKTPMLDRYEAAKARASELVSDEFFEVTFRESPLAEEALRLKAALIRVEDQYRELSSQYKATLYEYEGVKERLRSKHNGEVAKQQQEVYAES